ncbi:MAG: DUF1850 domain-containing protein [Desulfurococcales archaeon]|nr:DUF1850 domain-containing protein [Desulfurococcales archaeon]
MPPRSVIATTILVLGVLYLALSAQARVPTARYGTLVIECDGAIHRFRLEGEVYVIYNWTHSVEGTLIMEKYRADPDRGLVLVLAAAKSFGAGHPYNAEELGGTFYYKGDLMYYTANVSMGDEIDIAAPRGYGGNITVIWNGARLMVCPSFQEGSIRVSP